MKQCWHIHHFVRWVEERWPAADGLCTTHPVRRRGSAHTALWPDSPSRGRSYSAGWGCASASWSLWQPDARTSEAEDRARCPLENRDKITTHSPMNRGVVCPDGYGLEIRHVPISRRAASMTAAPFNMVAIKMSWPGQSTKDTCLRQRKPYKC